MSSLTALPGFMTPTPASATQSGGTLGGISTAAEKMAPGADGTVSPAFAALLVAAFDEHGAQVPAQSASAASSERTTSDDADEVAQDGTNSAVWVNTSIPGFTWAPSIDATGAMQDPGTVTLDAWVPEGDVSVETIVGHTNPEPPNGALGGRPASDVPLEMMDIVAASVDAEAATANRASEFLDIDAIGRAQRESIAAVPAHVLLAEGLEKLEGVDPAFRAALERTVGRMVAEGHSVRIIETSRSQERQDALFAQGRTAPGPVVTWTRQSRHLVGRAADLQVDGQWTGPGYVRMQAIAREEGLHTLGARDPGHVELKVATTATPAPRTAASRQVTMDADRGRPTLASPGAPVDRAAVGRRMTASREADVVTRLSAIPLELEAQRPALDRGRDAAVLVAARARAAQLIRALGGEAPTNSSLPGAPAVTARTAEGAAFGAEPTILALLEGPPAWAEERRPDQSAWSDNPVIDRASGFESLRSHASTAESRARIHDLPTTVHSPESARAPAMLTQRIEQLLAQREQARTGPMASITIAVDAANGTTDRVRIGLTGRQLGATILTDDPAAARAMSRDLGGLSDALARTGVDGSAVTVHDVAATSARQAARAADAHGDAAQASIAGRIGAADAARPAGASNGDSGAEQRRQDREQPQRQGGESRHQQGEQRDSQHRRQRREQDEQPAAARFKLPFSR